MGNRDRWIMGTRNGHVVIAPVNPDMNELEFTAQRRRDHGEQSSANDNGVED